MSDRTIRRAAERQALKAAHKAALLLVRQNAAADSAFLDSLEQAVAEQEATQQAAPYLENLDQEPTADSAESQPSAARLAANRANAQLSTGPVSIAGKAKVSLNAVKTGLTGRKVILATEDAIPYQALMLEYQKDFQPVGAEERALVQSIVDCRWRLDRIPGLEMALLTIGRQQLAADRPKYDQVGWAAVTEMQIRLDYEKSFRNLALQESRLNRRREKDLAQLLHLQQERKAKEKEALELAAQAYLLAKHRNTPFNLTELGFVFSTQKFEAHLASLTAVRKQQLLQAALKGADETQQAAA